MVLCLLDPVVLGADDLAVGGLAVEVGCRHDPRDRLLQTFDGHTAAGLGTGRGTRQYFQQ